MTVTEILLDILIVLVAAKLAAELAERIQVPAVVAEILAGVLIGPSVLGLVGTTEVLEALAELGVILLLLQVGMQMDVRELRAVGRACATVAVVGVGVSTIAGIGVCLAFGYDGNTALFVGAAISATSVGISARVFSDLRALGSVEARTVLGAAVADDVLGLIMLTVVVRIVNGGSVSLGGVASIVAIALGFLLVTVVVGRQVGPRLFELVHRHARSAGTLVALALAFTLAFAELADAAQLAPIIGAFVAGLALSGSQHRERISRELTPVGHLFIPVFFLQIGINADVGSFAKWSVLGVAAALLVVAIAGKLLAATGAIGSPGDKWLIGFGMIPRGEVILIFATIGLREGVFGENLYAALLLVVLATTLLTPPSLRWRLVRLRADRRPRLGAGEPMPEGGWLWVDDGVVDLAGEPPERVAVAIALEAALLIADGGVPGPRLLDWLSTLDEAPVYWDTDATNRLFEVLLRGNERTWRFLETSGILERALPELAEAVRRRRADPHVLDPSQVLRFELVECIGDIVRSDPLASVAQHRLEHPEWLLLAALILDTAGEDTEPVALARRLVKRLDLGAAAEEQIALLVGDSGLMRGAAGRVDGLSEESVFHLATYLERPERTRALYILSVALGELEPVARVRLDELLALVLAVLEQPGLTGLDARNLVERRRAEAMRLADGSAPALDRIRHAPRAYLLAEDAQDVARQAALLEPLPGRGRARVAVSTVEAGWWRVEVASRDRPGLLAAVSGVLAEHGLDVADAVVATWGDGAALESFRVRCEGTAAPDPGRLEAAIGDAFDRPLTSPANPEAEVSFDDAGSPWYTLCEVRSADRPGLLHTITVGLASVGASVHSARLETVDRRAVDRFSLTDATGRKLDRAAKDAARAAILGGVSARRRRFARFIRV